MIQMGATRTPRKLRRQPRGLCFRGVEGSPALSRAPQRSSEIFLNLFHFPPLLLCALHEGQVLEG